VIGSAKLIVVAAAKAYIAHGLVPVPVVPNSKKPAINTLLIDVTERGG
jgi:hypothetical protein